VFSTSGCGVIFGTATRGIGGLTTGGLANEGVHSFIMNYKK